MILWQRLLTISATDEDTQRRGRHLVLITSMLIVMSVLLFVNGIISHGLTPVSLLLVVVEVLYIAILQLAWRGRVLLGGALLTSILIPAILSNLGQSNLNSVVSLFLTLPLLIASLVLPPRAVGAVLAALLIGGLALRVPADQATTAVVLGLVLVALLAFLGASSIHTALAEASAARGRVEQAAAELAQANGALELQVQERTQRLQELLAEAEQRAAVQARLLEENAAQRLTIRDLEVPILPVSRSTLVMPLIGALDDKRLATMQTRALETIKDQGAEWLLLDITGVPVVDTAVAQGLLAVVQAARLLGSNVVLIGVRPEVAQTLVSLGLDMSQLNTMRDLQTSIQRLLV